jgi:translation initiation factor 4E
LSIWTRQAPNGTGTPDDEKLRQRIEAIGKHFKTQVRIMFYTCLILPNVANLFSLMQVLGYGDQQKLGGPLATDVEFVSHKDSEKKGKAKKIVV